MPSIRRAAFAALVPLLIVTCNESDPDPLDPGVVEVIAQEEGDAEGSDQSGQYVFKSTGRPTCDCPMTSQIALCSVDLSTLTTIGVEINIIQSDGALVISAESADGALTLSGAIDADGGFDVGGVYNLDSVIGQADIYIRLTGFFTAPGSLTATLRDRVKGQFGDQSVDCRTNGEVAATRAPAS